MRDNNNQTVISIIIPAYNSEDCIKRCLDSLISQSTVGAEIIIVNDGSVDNTESICSEYVKNHDNIHLISIPNSGVSVARNTGLEKAKGKYIAFVDADDYVANDYIDTLLLTAERMQSIQSELAIFSYFTCAQTVKINHVNGEIGEFSALCRDLCCQRYNAPWNKLFCAEIIKNHSLCFPRGMKSSEDGIFLMDYIRFVHRALPVDKAVYYYVKNSGGAVSNTRLGYIDDNFIMHSAVAQFAKDNCPENIHLVCRETVERVFHIINKLLCKSVDKRLLSDKLLQQKEKIAALDTGLDKKNKIKLLMIKYRLYFLIKYAIKD